MTHQADAPKGIRRQDLIFISFNLVVDSSRSSTTRDYLDRRVRLSCCQQAVESESFKLASAVLLHRIVGDTGFEPVTSAV